MVQRRLTNNITKLITMAAHREHIELGSLPHHFDKPVPLAVIGGTGLYDLPNLKPVARLTISTPWGFPSAPIPIFETDSGYAWAFAVGSLQQEIKPRDFVLPTQIIDRTKGIRPSTFFERGFVAHAMFGEPFDLTLSKIISENVPSSGFLEGFETDARPTFHTKHNTNNGEDLTLICMEGPQFSTRAESKLYRSWGGSVINMSALPEAKLAREAEIAYQMICMSTDYDSWNESEDPVTVETVVGNLKANSANACKLAAHLIEVVSKDLALGTSGVGKGLKGSMKYSVSTSPHGVKKELLEKMHFLFQGYWPVQ